MSQSIEWPRRMVISTELQLDHINGVNNALNHLIPLFKNAGIGMLIFSPSPTKGMKLPFYSNARIGILDWGRLGEEFRDIKPDVALAFAPAIQGTVLLDWAEMNNIPRAASFSTNIPGYTKSYGLAFMEKFVRTIYREIHNQAQLNLVGTESTAKTMRQDGFRNVKV